MLYIVGSEYGETQLQPTILVWFGFLRNETESNTEGFVGTHNPGDVEEKYVVLFFSCEFTQGGGNSNRT